MDGSFGQVGEVGARSKVAMGMKVKHGQTRHYINIDYKSQILLRPFTFPRKDKNINHESQDRPRLAGWGQTVWNDEDDAPVYVSNSCLFMVTPQQED